MDTVPERRFSCQERPTAECAESAARYGELMITDRKKTDAEDWQRQWPVSSRLRGPEELSDVNSST